MTDGRHGFAGVHRVAREIDHRVTHAHLVRRMTAGNHERVEIVHARRPGREIRCDDGVSALAAVLGVRRRPDERHRRAGVSQRVEWSGQLAILEPLLDEQRDAFAGQHGGITHGADSILVERLSWVSTTENEPSTAIVGPRQRGVPTAHACAVGCERGVPTAHACAVGCERRGPTGNPSGHSTSDIMIGMNRLAQERSPYLLQHANNPVEWFPWSDEAFAKARVEDKPIFLSVGYSTCHWCHVMEHESFENDDVAAVLNANFVSIKVDREERPDVDRVYMTFVQATTGGGGWPMSVWLTPDLKPFYGGTDFPPPSPSGRPGFVDILQEIARVWRAERDKVAHSAESLTAQLRAVEHGSPTWTLPTADALAATVKQFRDAFDARYGGFGSSPKFPRPSELLFLLREHARTREPTGERGRDDPTGERRRDDPTGERGRDDPKGERGGEAVDSREMVLRTLRAMALGGMRDHVGRGFHRYSVDAAWRVPHLEKMLYDQAQLGLAFLEGAQASGDPFYTQVA